MRVHLPSPDDLALENLDTETIARALKASQEGIQAMQQLQRHAFAATFVKFFHDHPEASLFVCGQTGEYTDEGYAGCWVARIDPEYVREQAKTTTEKRDGYYSRRLASDKDFNADVRSFRGEYDEKEFGVLPQGLEALSLKEFDAFSSLSGLADSWRDVADFNNGDSNGGMVYQKQDLRELLGHLGANLQEMTALIENQALTKHVEEKGVEVKKPRKRTPKAL